MTIEAKYLYICICKAVTDAQIRKAISQGACTRKQLIACLNVGRDCGKCNAEVRELLDGHAPRIQSAQQAPACGQSSPDKVSSMGR